MKYFSMAASASALVCLAALTLPGSTGADAAIYTVNVTGSFTDDMFPMGPGDPLGPPPLDLPAPFAGSFDVDTSTAPIQHLSEGGYTMTGYPDAAISNVSISAIGTSFLASDILDRIFIAGVPGSAVYFSEDLYPGATPSIWMAFGNLSAQLFVGEGYCGNISFPSCGIDSQLSIFINLPYFDVIEGSVSASVVAPEPSTWAMALIGVSGLAFARYRRVRPSGLPHSVA